MPGDDLAALNPPQANALHWWLVLAGVTLVAVTLLVTAAVMLLRRPAPPVEATTLSTLREAALADIESVREQHTGGFLTAQAAARELSRVLRRFVSEAEEGSLGFATADQLVVAAVSDHRLVPVADVVREVATSSFSRSGRPDVERLAERSAEVVHEWC